MAGILATYSPGEIALTANVPKTVAQLAAAANHRVKLTGFWLGLKGTGTNDAPVRVRILRQTTGGTMTASAAIKKDSTQDETVQTVCQHTATVEPTAGDVLEVQEIHPQGGLRVFYPFGQEIVVPGGGRIGMEVLAANAVTVSPGFEFEE